MNDAMAHDTEAEQAIIFNVYFSTRDGIFIVHIEALKDNCRCMTDLLEVCQGLRRYSGPAIDHQISLMEFFRYV